MITRYENGISFPRTREAYRKVADFFGVDANYFLSDEDASALNAVERYGSKGMRQARELVDGISGLFASGELSEQEKDAVMKALQDAYWEAKARNAKKHAPGKLEDADA